MSGPRAEARGERGVEVTPHPVDGLTLLVVRDSRGCVLVTCACAADDVDALAQAFLQFLEEVDPPPWRPQPVRE